MNRHLKLRRILPLVIVLTALPALAQFEVSPDHFDEQATTKAPSATRQAEHAVLKQQLAFERAQLEGYRRQIENKATQVERARQATILSMGNTVEASASNTLAIQEEKLAHLRATLAGPMRETAVRIARLEAQLFSTPGTVVGHPR